MSNSSASMDFVFDFETLGKGENTVILSLAAVPFNWERLVKDGDYQFEQLKDSGFEIKFDVADQVKNWGRKIDSGTVEWWEKQSEEAQKILKPSKSDMPFQEGVRAISEEMQNRGLQKGSQLFCRGQDFDPPILNAILTQTETDFPVNFWDYRDIRSMIQAWIMQRRAKYFPAYDSIDDKMTLHSAIDDCAGGVIEMQMAYEKMYEVIFEEGFEQAGQE